MTAIIETHGLRKHYGAVQALAGVDLAVPPGTIFGFLGPNGAGKTTMIRILVGLLRANGGRASVFSLDPWRQRTDVLSRVGYLPGDVRFPDWMTAARFLADCDEARGGGAAQEIKRLAARFGIDLRRKIRECSRGMKQKVGLIQALMHRPDLLILDEPTAGLDPLMQQTLYAELRHAAADGRTILFSSHTLSEVEALCDRVAIIRAGRIIEDSTIADLKSRAFRRIEFRLVDRSAASLDMPEGLTIRASADGRVRGSWKGSVRRLLPWLAELDVEDVTITPPDLEDLFAAYYRTDDDEPESGP